MIKNSRGLPQKRRSFIILLLSLFTVKNPINSQNTYTQLKPRIVITCDPELDDNNSLIRFLLYSSDANVEGLIYTSSQFHWKGDGKGTRWFVPGREYARFGLDTCPCVSWRWGPKERFIHDIVDAYTKVYPNLKVHQPDYPAPDLLRSKIRYGNIEFDGDISKESPGSKLIHSLIMDNKPGPLYLTAWGGHSTIARALKSIQEQYEYTTEWEQIKKKISSKVVLLPSGDQDDMYTKYIRPNWPDIEYRQFRGGPNYGYGAQLRAKNEDSTFLTSSWMKENITGRGVLGALYRVWGDGKQMVEGDKMDYFGLSGYTSDELKKMGYVVWMSPQPKGSWLGEGDNPTFMNMLGNGLRAFESGSYGGWGGRAITIKDVNSFAFQLPDTTAEGMAALLSTANDRLRNADYPNFFPTAQRDFAARLKWTVTPKYTDANHEPSVKIEGPLSIMVNAGDKIRLNGAVSDPDGDEVNVKWWQFQVGTYPEKVSISNPESLQTQIMIPKDAVSGQNIHFILEGTDNGVPALTRYQRVIIKIR